MVLKTVQARSEQLGSRYSQNGRTVFVSAEKYYPEVSDYPEISL